MPVFGSSPCTAVRVLITSADVNSKADGVTSIDLTLATWNLSRLIRFQCAHPETFSNGDVCEP